MSDRAEHGRVEFECNGTPVAVDAHPGESLLLVLREQLGIASVKDGCAPQGQCGCCTVLVDGEARVACVTPVARVAGRAVTTIEGLAPDLRTELVDAFVETGGSQCGFCTPGILVRAAALRAKGRGNRIDLDRALAAHLCRCTGWQTIYEALDADRPRRAARRRDLDAAGQRAALEGGVAQRVGPEVPFGQGGFADDTAPRDAVVAVPLPPGSDAEGLDAVGLRWVVGAALDEARSRAGKVQGRRSTVGDAPPLHLPEPFPGGVRLATGWVEPAYLEPDASWCEPGGQPASPLANAGAFGGKARSLAPGAARALADELGRTVRVVLSREDVVRLGPKRPPVALRAVLDGDVLRLDGRVAGPVPAERLDLSPYAGLTALTELASVAVPGPPTALDLRAAVHAELRVVQEGALEEAGFDRVAHLHDDRAAAVFLDNAVGWSSTGMAGARVRVDAGTGAVERIEITVAAGDPLDEVVVRSYAIGAAHMALGWVLSEGIAVDPETGEVQDLTIRSFGIVRPKAMPPVEVTVVDDPGPPLAVSDAVFTAVAAAAWNAVSIADGARPKSFPARSTRAARRLRR